MDGYKDKQMESKKKKKNSEMWKEKKNVCTYSFQHQTLKG